MRLVLQCIWPCKVHLSFCIVIEPCLFAIVQFETRRYKKVVSGVTRSADEVHWMMEHLKLYEFTGVQVKVSSMITRSAAEGRS